MHIAAESAIIHAEPHSSVGSVTDLITGGRWFDPRLGESSFRGLTIIIFRQDFLLSQRCPLFRQLLYGKASSGLERMLCRVLIK